MLTFNLGAKSKEIAGFIGIPLTKKNEKYFTQFYFEYYVKVFATPYTVIRVLVTFRGLNDDNDEDYS